MRRLLSAGGLAIAACTCGLLFSGAASARQASETISVSGVVKGTSIKFTGSGSPVLEVWVDGGSSFQFTAISSAGANCDVTPTNGGGFCSFATPVTSFVLSTTFSGQTPTAVAGQVGYADTSTGTFSVLVTPASECHCTNLSVALKDFKTAEDGSEVAFVLKWRLDCSTGTTNYCAGEVESFGELQKELHKHGLHLHEPPDSPTFIRKSPVTGGFIITCNSHHGSNGCNRSEITGNEKFELLGPAKDRSDLTINWLLHLGCNDLPNRKVEKEKLSLKFDAKGNLEPNKSELGMLD